MSPQDEIDKAHAWMNSPRFADTQRLYAARQVVDQRGTILAEYTVARDAAERFYALLQDLRATGKSVTTFGPYSPGQAVAMKRAGIRCIYLGGWATSAKGSVTEDPGPDLASYPLSQVPDEAAPIVRALLTADRNQHYLRSQGRDVPEVDFRPYIIADADTGHGGDAHVRNLIRRFVEVGVPGYHIEDQRPGSKKCGHQGGKVLVAVDEQIKRLNAARFQLDVMGVPGLIVARTDAESASLLEACGDERDHPFILGATNEDVPSYKTAFLAVQRTFHDLGVDELRGHLLFAQNDETYAEAKAWLAEHGFVAQIEVEAEKVRKGAITSAAALKAVAQPFMALWEAQAGLKTFPEAVADLMRSRSAEGEAFEWTVDAWRSFASTASHDAARRRARAMGIETPWDCDLAKTPEGYYQIRGGIDYAIAKCLAVAPFCDILWMETKTADLADAKHFADAIHAVFPGKMLAYNLSPSFNWDTTGMDDDQMRAFPLELGKMGFVFNFITYGGHQIDGLAAEEFSASLLQDGMLALARLQRKFRLLQSPYQTPQTLVGGPRADAALMAVSGRTATTTAMGKGSTQHQHLVQTEVPTALLEEWLGIWSGHHGLAQPMKVKLRPNRPGSDLLEISLRGEGDVELANVIFANTKDRRGRVILSVRDQNTFDLGLRKKRLMTLIHLFLIHRYKALFVHYLSPTEDNHYQTQKMMTHGLFSAVHDEVGQIITADVDSERVKALLAPDRSLLTDVICKRVP